MFYFEHATDTIYLKHFYHNSFVGDEMAEEIRKKKVAALIKQMGDKYLLATRIQKIID